VATGLIVSGNFSVHLFFVLPSAIVCHCIWNGASAIQHSSDQGDL
jgi:hypothetical protein